MKENKKLLWLLTYSDALRQRVETEASLQDHLESLWAQTEQQKRNNPNAVPLIFFTKSPAFLLLGHFVQQLGAVKTDEKVDGNLE